MLNMKLQLHELHERRQPVVICHRRRRSDVTALTTCMLISRASRHPFRLTVALHCTYACFYRNTPTVTSITL
jgi:hypothetical protein